MTGGFFERLDELKRVLASSMSVEDKLAQVQPLLRDADVQREFWNLLDDEEWVAVLKQAGFFNGPPTPEISEGGTRFHSWGASKFLARIASRAPSEVASVFSSLETENVSVIGDMLDAAAAMPIADAAAFVPAVCRAAAAGILWIHFKDASDLCVRLAEEGEVDLALSLAEALFSPKGENLKTRPGRSDSYWYKEGLKAITPVLSVRGTQTFLPMLCDWLGST
jgi:hypothetical protein